MIDQTAIDRLETYQREGRLIRNAWVGTDAQGRETACLLAALVPEWRGRDHKRLDAPDVAVLLWPASRAVLDCVPEE